MFWKTLTRDQFCHIKHLDSKSCQQQNQNLVKTWQKCVLKRFFKIFPWCKILFNDVVVLMLFLWTGLFHQSWSKSVQNDLIEPIYWQVEFMAYWINIGEITPCIRNPCKKKCSGNIFIYGWCLISFLSLIGDNEETLTFPPSYVQTETCQQCFDPPQLHFLSCCSVCRSQRVEVLSVLSQIDPAKWAAYHPPIYSGSR